jgi:tRNA threonylcarbamoyladenosine dehydratase
MSFDFLSRTEMMIDKDKMQKLKNAHVIIFGLGGVGSCASEMICRAGVGELTLLDGDIVVLSNLNRQLHSTRVNINLPKTQALKERLTSINPEIKINIIQKYLKFKEEFFDVLQLTKYDYAIDSIDTLTSKCFLIENAVKMNIPIVTSFGAGGRMDPTKVEISDISKTHHCRLAYYVRKKLHKVGIFKGVRTVFSSEVPAKEFVTLEAPVQGKKSTIGTISYMPNLFGCFVASEVIQNIINT